MHRRTEGAPLVQPRDLPRLHSVLLERMREEMLLEDIDWYYPRDVGLWLFADRFEQPPLYF